MTRVLADRAQLAGTVLRLGGELGAAHPDGVVLVGVLPGVVPFLADLVRAVPPPAPVLVDFLAVTPFPRGRPPAPLAATPAGRVRFDKDLDVDVAGRDVVLVEDVVDTGLTTRYLLAELRGRGARSVEVCALVDKVSRRLVPVPLRWVGLTVEADYVVGYGLGHGGRYRDLDRVVEADLEGLRRDPDALLGALYGPGVQGGARR